MLGAVRWGQRVKGSGQPQWRDLGERLAHTLRQGNGAITTPARLQGLVADLAAEHTELMLPLRDLVTRPAFQALIPRSGTGTGAVQRDALLQEMEATFSRQVIAAIAELLDGFLDLPPGAAMTPPPPTRPAPPPPPPPPPPSPLPLPSPLPPPAPVPVQAPVQAYPQGAQPQPPSAPLPPPVPVWPAEPAPLERSRERGVSGCGLVLLGLVTALAVAGGVVLLRATDLCALVGFCPGVQVASGVQQALQAAEQAEQDLRGAEDLGAYERALVALERHLLELANARLTPEQEQRRQRLDQVARDARDVLAEENNDLRRLDKVARALASARESSGEQRTSLLAIATQELEAIAPRGFAAPEAKRLREQLEQLARESLVTEPPAPEESGDGEAPAVDSQPPPEAPPPPPSASPLPVAPPPPVPSEEPAP